MSDDQEPVVIVDPGGTEHEFPPGMDPKKAGLVVSRVYGDAQAAKAQAKATADSSVLAQWAPSKLLGDVVNAGSGVLRTLKPLVTEGWKNPLGINPPDRQLTDEQLANMRLSDLPSKLAADIRSAPTRTDAAVSSAVSPFLKPDTAGQALAGAATMAALPVVLPRASTAAGRLITRPNIATAVDLGATGAGTIAGHVVGSPTAGAILGTRIGGTLADMIRSGGEAPTLESAISDAVDAGQLRQFPEDMSGVTRKPSGYTRSPEGQRLMNEAAAARAARQAEAAKYVADNPLQPPGPAPRPPQPPVVDPYLPNKTGYDEGSLFQELLNRAEPGAAEPSGRIPITGEPAPPTDPNAAPPGVNRYLPNVSSLPTSEHPITTERVPYVGEAPGPVMPRVPEPDVPQQGVLKTRPMVEPETPAETAAEPGEEPATTSPHGELTDDELNMVRQIAAENDELRFTRRSYVPAGPRRGGDITVVGGSGGASSLQDVFNEGGYGSRAQVLDAANNVIDGTGSSTKNTRAVIEAARARLRGEAGAGTPGSTLPPNAYETYETPREQAARQASGAPRRGIPTPDQALPVSGVILEEALRHAQETGKPLDVDALQQSLADRDQFISDLVDQHLRDSAETGGGDVSFEFGGEPEGGTLTAPTSDLLGERPMPSAELLDSLRNDKLGARDAAAKLRSMGYDIDEDTVRQLIEERSTGKLGVRGKQLPLARHDAIENRVNQIIAESGDLSDAQLQAKLKAYVESGPEEGPGRGNTLQIIRSALRNTRPGARWVVGGAAGGTALRQALVNQLQQQQEPRKEQ